MINGDYILMIAPSEWMGKKYRDRYIYEHHYVYWKHTGVYIDETQIIHHCNENKHDNRFENLELQTRKQHAKQHAKQHGKNRVKKMVKLKCPSCDTVFSREHRGTHLTSSKKTVTTCSRSCSAKLSSFVRKGGCLESLTEDNVIEIFYI